MRTGKEDRDGTPEEDEVTVDGPWPPHPDPRIITPEKIAQAGQMSAQVQLHGAGIGQPAEYGPKDYTLVRYDVDVDGDSEIVNGIRYTIPCFKPSQAGGRVVRQRRRVRRGSKETEVIASYRIHDQESTTTVRYDAEALCEPFKANGICHNPGHPHAWVHSGVRPKPTPDTEEESRVL